MAINEIKAVAGTRSKVTTPAINYIQDENQMLVIKGVDLPEYYEVEFCNVGDQETVTMVGDESGVMIPDQFLTTGKDVKAYLVLTEGESVQTRMEITIPVNYRPLRTDVSPTPAEQQQIDALVEAMNSAVAAAEESAGEAQDAADRAEASAEEAEQIATEAVLDAEAYAAGTRNGVPVTSGDVAYENNAKYYAEEAAGCVTAAGAAQDAAVVAQGKAEDAQAAAEAAQGEAEAAQAAAEGFAEDAETQADNAAGSATAAAGSATAAAGSATAAAGSAATAGTRATAAADSAEAAGVAQTAAETAQEKAEYAQAVAEEAQGEAETAEAGAEVAREAAETAQGKAEDAQTGAETAQGKAEDAQAAAETAQAAAEAAAESIEESAEQIAQNTTDIAELQSDVSGLTSSVTELTSDLGELTTDVTELTGDVTDLTGDVSDLKNAITVLPDYRFPFQKNSTLKDAQGNDISSVLYGAFKDIRIYGASASDKLSFGRIKVSASQILITVWNTSYTVVSQYYKNVSTLPVGVEKVNFGQVSGSGVTLKSVIDWNAFTNEVDYSPLIYSRCGFADSCYANVHDLEISDIVDSINSTNEKLDKIKSAADSIGVYQPDASLTDSNNNDISAFLLGAITDLYLLNAVDNEQYSIGTFVRSASDGHFQLTIWNKSYQLVCQVYVADASAYTGKKTLTLTALNNSGITGEITIDFDVVASGTSYTQLIYRRAGFADKYVYGHLREQYLKEIAETGGGIGTHRWKGEKWYAIGDSFTEQNIYPYYLNQYCGFASYYNAGQSGRGMSAMADKLSVEALTDYDIVTVFAGTNDYGDGTALGTITDTSSTASFYGYTRKVIEAIIAQKPTIRIAFMTPTIRGAFEDQPVYPAANSAGVTLIQYADAIKEVCAEYAIPVLDLFRSSQFNLLTLSALTQDNLHPNTTGGQMLARQIQGFIEAL